VRRRLTLDDLRGFAVNRSLFTPTSLTRAIDKLAFVQADPIRAPARAQDLTLRHRVRGYRAGDLERRYASLGIEEDVFINYGFLPRSVQALMHPRAGRRAFTSRRVRALLDFVRERGVVHPREVDAHFAHGTVTNYWGGSSSATTHLLERMHYDGLLRVARRDGGIRIYAPSQDARPVGSVSDRRARIDALVDVVVHAYAPVAARALAVLVRRLRYAVPQWQGELSAALTRSRQRLAQARIDGIDWYWPDGEPLRSEAPEDGVRLLAPFDPIVWDRGRFETFWGWAYRFEAYTPAAKRKLGYYALPLLWRDRVIGWGNVAVNGRGLDARVDYVEPALTRDPAFRRELDLELDRMRTFLGVGASSSPPRRSSHRTARLLENVSPKPYEPLYD
jgi:uncharacterized protein YcaQ